MGSNDRNMWGTGELGGFNLFEWSIGCASSLKVNTTLTEWNPFSHVVNLQMCSCKVVSVATTVVRRHGEYTLRARLLKASSTIAGPLCCMIASVTVACVEAILCNWSLVEHATRGILCGADR